MFKSISKIATSVMGLLNQTPPVSDSVRDARSEDVREALLYLLEKCEPDSMTQRLTAQVLHARDLEALWYLRAPIFTQLVTVMGDAWAKEQVDSVTHMFEGYLSPSHFPTRNKPGER